MSIIEALARSGTKVAVVCGGPGGEREVSLASGENAHRALNEAGLAASKAVVPAEDPGAFLERLECGLAVMMLHGEFGEDGTAQRILERRGVAFTGSDSRACALAMDKDATKRLLTANAIPTPRWVVADAPEAAAAAAKEAGLAFPLFVKPNFGGSSVGVSRVESPEEIMPAVAKTLGVGRLAMIEEMVTGRELTIGWLDGKVLPIIELQADGVFYDYRAKYVSDATRYLCPAALDGATEDAINGHVARMAELMGVRDLARVDVMLGADGPRVLELNTLPGFTTHSLLPMAARAAGMPIGDLCVSLAGMAAKRAGLV